MLDGSAGPALRVIPDGLAVAPGPLVIGIDPGLRGAGVAVTAAGQLVAWFDTPTERAGKKLRHICSAMATDLVALIDSAQVAAVWVERPQATPIQSRASAFGMGEGYGIWEGIIAALGLPLETVRPMDWQKEILHGVEGEGKQRSLLWASRRFPGLPLTPRMDGRSDAAGIAEYGRRRMFK